MADDDIMEQKLTIVFDDAKISIPAITDGMRKADFPVEGDPELIKQ